MALDDYKIVDADYTGKDVSGLADKPTLTAAQLKARFDSLVKNVVAVRYNACIDALKTLIAGLASKVTGATNGNFAGLDADGNLTDSGKNAGDFEPLSIVRHTVYKNSLGEEWFKILSFPISERATVKISCYSSHASILQRGHWEMIINRDLDGNIRADLIYSTNVVTSKFSVRSDSGVLKLYFSTPQYTEFTILSEVIIGDATLTTYADTAETPSGTEVTVNYADTAVIARRREASASITLSAIVFQYEVTVAWATPSMWFQAIRTDEIMSYFTHPIRAYCETAGKVKVYLNMYPDAAQNGTTMNLKISGWR